MQYQLTQHARQTTKKRRIPLEWLERTLTSPQTIENDLVDPDLEHRCLEIPEVGNRILRVIIKKSVDPHLIITAYFEARRKKL